MLIGSLIVIATIVIHAVFIAFAIDRLRRWGPRLVTPPLFAKIILALITMTLWMLAAHSVEVWLWALVFLQLGAFSTLEPALYFSLVAFTTLGFGDITLGSDLRLLSGLTAANGLLLFAFSAAFLFEAISRLYQFGEAAGGERQQR